MESDGWQAQPAKELFVQVAFPVSMLKDPPQEPQSHDGVSSGQVADGETLAIVDVTVPNDDPPVPLLVVDVAVDEGIRVSPNGIISDLGYAKYWICPGEEYATGHSSIPRFSSANLSSVEFLLPFRLTGRH